MITIVDYGMGNLHSVRKAVERAGVAAEVTSEPEAVARAERLILPGVGGFGDAIGHLRAHHLVEPILEYLQRGRPFLGICLGLQLLFETGYEDGVFAGLGVFEGEVVRFTGPAYAPPVDEFSATVPACAVAEGGALPAVVTLPAPAKASRQGLKVPHMGWNALDIRRRPPVLDGLGDRPSVYFVHSYHVVPKDASIIATTTDYGGPFVSMVWHEHIMACQFHPEKSQAVGLALIDRFVHG